MQFAIGFAKREYHDCAFCKKNDLRSMLVKYSIRRYAHGECLLKHKGPAALDALPLAELYRLPVPYMLDLGYDVKAAIKRRKDQEKK